MEETAKIDLPKVRDQEITRQACELLDRTREEPGRKHGVLDIGVPAIREFGVATFCMKQPRLVVG